MTQLPEVMAAQSPKKKTAKKKKARKPKYLTIGIIAFFLVVFCVYLLLDTIRTGATSLIEHYKAAYEQERDITYDSFYQSAFERAEQNYHLSNTAVISIESLEECGKLEVMKANCVEFITEDRDSNSGNITAWLEVSGEGTFVVDLEAAEFIVNQEYSYVLARIPCPELTNITILDTTKRWFSDDWWNGSYSEGVDLAIKQRNEASLQIQKSLMSNVYIYSNAQEAAEQMLIQLIKQINTDIPDLTVEVEFIG